MQSTWRNDAASEPPGADGWQARKYRPVIWFQDTGPAGHRRMAISVCCHRSQALVMGRFMGRRLPVTFWVHACRSIEGTKHRSDARIETDEEETSRGDMRSLGEARARPARKWKLHKQTRSRTHSRTPWQMRARRAPQRWERGCPQVPRTRWEVQQHHNGDGAGRGHCHRFHRPSVSDRESHRNWNQIFKKGLRHRATPWGHTVIDWERTGLQNADLGSE